MELGFSKDDERFRMQVREFFENEYPKDLLARIHGGQRLTKDDHVQSQKALQSRGWFAANWPAEFGGPGWNAVQRYIFEEEMDRVGALSVIPMGVIYVAPVIYTFGTPEQQRRWLPDILSSTSFWCQGYSEPEAGSDLTSLRMRADRDGDHYVVSGSKIWTSLAQWADWIFCLVRTDAKASRHEGISFLCIDMKSPGVSVRPIISMDGTHHLNQVFFDDVRVPANNLIGAEGKGWTYAQFLLKNERLSYAHVGRKKEDLKRIRRLAQQTSKGLGMLGDDPLFMARLAHCEIAVATFEITVLRALCAGDAVEITSAAAIKILATEIAQQITELALELAGPQMQPWSDREGAQWNAAFGDLPVHGPVFAANYLFERAQTIYGGTTEVQNNIIAKALLRSARA